MSKWGSILAIVPIILLGCDKSNHEVQVRFKDLSKILTEDGTINISQLKLGSFYAADADGNNGIYIGEVAYDTNSDVSSSKMADRTSYKLAAELECQFDATIPKAIQVKIQTEIQSNTELLIRNKSRKSLKNYIANINSDSTLRRTLTNTLQANPNMHLYFIHTVIFADTLSLIVANSRYANSAGNMLKYGEYKISVKFADSAKFEIIKANAFRKASEIKYDSAAHNFVLNVFKQIMPIDTTHHLSTPCDTCSL
jgi:hypothetical protein